jgi:hypothetical protein
MPGQYLVRVEIEHHVGHVDGKPNDEPRVLVKELALRERVAWKRERYIAAALRDLADQLDHDSVPRGMKAVFDHVAADCEKAYAELPSTLSLTIGLLVQVAGGLGVEWQPPLIVEQTEVVSNGA